MAKKKTTLTNWLNTRINGGDLVDHGFINMDGADPAAHTKINNTEGYDDVYYFPSVDAVVLRVRNGKDKGWYMALDSECDSFWKGDLNTMGDVFAVLILLSK